MSIFQKNGLAVLSAICLIVGAVHAQDNAGSQDTPDLPGGTDSSGQAAAVAPSPDASSEQMRMDQLAIQQLMSSVELMAEAKEELLSDDAIAERVAREILIQEMVMDHEYLATMRDALRTDTDNEPEMTVLIDKISSAKAKLVKDKDALMSMTQELMVRQLAANRIAMINGGRFNQDGSEPVNDETVTEQGVDADRGEDAETPQPDGANEPALADQAVDG